MLKEQQNVSQHEGEPRRRWFYSRGMDLVVWVDETGAPTGMQLSYEKSTLSAPPAPERKILTWLPTRGYSHEALDDGEDRPFRYKMTPVTMPDGVFERDTVLDRFLAESAEMDSAVRDFVLGKLRDYPV